MIDIDKKIFLKNPISISAIISLVSLFLPFFRLTLSTNDDFWGRYSESESFVMIKSITLGGWIPVVIAILPVLLIIMNNSGQPNKYKSMLFVLIPVACLINLIVTYIRLKFVFTSEIFGVYYTSGSEVKMAIGFYVVLASYLVSLVSGMKKYRAVFVKK